MSYDPKQDTVLTLETTGDLSVGIWPARVTLILPFSEQMLREDEDFRQDLKRDVVKLFASYGDGPIRDAMFDFEVEDMADHEEQLSERAKGQYD